MKRTVYRTLNTCVAVVMAAALLPTSLAAAQPESGMLAKVMALYGLDEEAAVERLARETDAADVYRRMKESQLSGYAGSWFDAGTLRLKVAISQPDDAGRVHALGADPVAVARSGEALQALLQQAVAHLRATLEPGVLRSTHVDPPSNRVVLGVAPAQTETVRARLREADIDVDGIDFIEVAVVPSLSSGAVRGADGTRNLTWEQEYWEDCCPCSIGAAIVGGYVTAGHCGFEGHETGAVDSTPLGEVEGSTWDPDPKIDAGWVSTYGGWTPQPLINGYSDGVLSVPAKWSGKNEAPLHATACRYGQTSGGPHCGEIVAQNQNVDFGDLGWILQLTKVLGSCTEAGDSGGPHLASDGQVQGVNVGTDALGCPASPCNIVYFQPIEDVLGEFGKTMLTTHGAAAPTVGGIGCLSPTVFGSYTYRCFMDYYNSQGDTSMSWSTSAGHTSSTTQVSGPCTPLATVNATLTLTNDYGSTPINDSVQCLP